MRRMAFAVVVLVGCWNAPARAETLPLIEGVPATYSPGQSFTFDVRVPFLPDLTSYNLQILFGAQTNDPALLAFPTVADPVPAGRYVFTSNENFSFSFDAPPGASEVSLTLSDFNSSVVARPGINDTIARITVLPDANFTGPIQISFAPDFQYNFREGPRYSAPEPIIVQQADPGAGNPVPAPPAALLFAAGVGLLAVRARIRLS
jgi:hypothetical protein